jgi:outer membrane lipoprotein carrier protein
MCIYTRRLPRVRRYFVLFIALIFCSQGFAESMDAPALLKHRLAKLQSFEAKFVQTVTDVDKEVLQEAQGNIALKQPNKFYWQLDAPHESVLIADGQTLWHVDPFVEQVVAMDQQQSVQNNPLILLTDPDSESWQDFLVSEQDNVFVRSARQEDASIVRLILRFEQEQLTELSMEDSQQQLSQLVFSDIQQNHGLAEGKFVFVQPQGYDLDDQRTP